MYYAVSKPQVIREQFDEEVVIVDLETGSYYSLSGAGGEVWNGIENGASQSQIVENLSHAYSGEKADIEAAVARLLQELQQEQLIVARPAAGSAASTPAEAAAPSAKSARPVFEEPVLQKFTDMQALLLLDPIHEVDQAGWPMPMSEDEATLPDTTAADTTAADTTNSAQHS